MKIYHVTSTSLNFKQSSLPSVPWDQFERSDPVPADGITVNWHFQGDIFNCVEFLSPAHRDHVLKNQSAVLFASRDWSEADLYAEDYDQASGLLILLLYSYLSTRNGLLFHSSLVDYNGNGVMFLGPSGIGKTTQAELWNKYLGAHILNGDMVFVREQEGAFHGYGSPWHGSSPYCMNADVRLRALVVLTQAPDNTLRRCSGLRDLQDVMQQAFLPHWDEAGLSACLDTLDRLLEQVPAYHLACRPDEEAVLLLKNELNL